MPEKVVIIGSRPAAGRPPSMPARANLQPVVFAGRPKQTPSIILPGGQLIAHDRRGELPRLPGGDQRPPHDWPISSSRRSASAHPHRDRRRAEPRCVQPRRRPLLQVPGLQVGGTSPAAVQGRRRGRPALRGPHGDRRHRGRPPIGWGCPNEMRLAQTGGGVSALRGLRRRAAPDSATRNWPWWAAATRPSRRPLPHQVRQQGLPGPTAAISFGPAASCKRRALENPKLEVL